MCSFFGQLFSHLSCTVSKMKFISFYCNFSLRVLSFFLTSGIYLAPITTGGTLYFLPYWSIISFAVPLSLTTDDKKDSRASPSAIARKTVKTSLPPCSGKKKCTIFIDVQIGTFHYMNNYFLLKPERNIQLKYCRKKLNLK